MIDRIQTYQSPDGKIMSIHDKVTGMSISMCLDGAIYLGHNPCEMLYSRLAHKIQEPVRMFLFLLRSGKSYLFGDHLAEIARQMEERSIEPIESEIRGYGHYCHDDYTAAFDMLRADCMISYSELSMRL